MYPVLSLSMSAGSPGKLNKTESGRRSECNSYAGSPYVPNEHSAFFVLLKLVDGFLTFTPFDPSIHNHALIFEVLFQFFYCRLVNCEKDDFTIGLVQEVVDPLNDTFYLC